MKLNNAVYIMIFLYILFTYEYTSLFVPCNYINGNYVGKYKYFITDLNKYYYDIEKQNKPILNHICVYNTNHNNIYDAYIELSSAIYTNLDHYLYYLDNDITKTNYILYNIDIYTKLEYNIRTCLYNICHNHCSDIEDITNRIKTNILYTISKDHTHKIVNATMFGDLLKSY